MLRVGTTLGPYQILAPLGAGGMGEVYRAHDPRLERDIALKVLPDSLTADATARARLIREARAAAALSHPNICTMYEVGESDGLVYIAMELVEGRPLSERIGGHPLPLESVIRYGAQIADALAHAHERHVIHRDLKSGNVMVSGDGRVKVLDFGLARRVWEKEEGPPPVPQVTLTESGVVVGTPHYLAPEVLHGEKADGRSDVWALGVVLYEMTAGVLPFRGATTYELSGAILNDAPVPLPGTVPAGLRAVIVGCLAKEPGERSQRASEVRAALEALRSAVEGAPQVTAGAVPGAAGAVPAGRRGLPVPLVAGLIVLGVAGIAFGWWGLQRSRNDSSRQPFRRISMSPLTSRGDVQDCALSADGRYLAYVAGTLGQQTLRVCQVQTGSDVELLPPSGAPIESPSFSPDGNYLCYRIRRPDQYWALNQIPALGGSPRQLAFDVDSRVTFSPDGRRAAFWRGVPRERKIGLVVMDLEAGGGKILATLRDPETFSGGPSWSPDGRQIAAPLYTPGAPIGTIALFDAATGRRRDAANLSQMNVWEIAWLRDGSRLLVSAVDLRTTATSQLWLLRVPGGTLERLTSDFTSYWSVSTSGGDQMIGAVRGSDLENLWIANAAGGEPRQLTRARNPATSPWSIAVIDSATLVYVASRGQDTQIWSFPISGGEPRALTGSGLSYSPWGARGLVYFIHLDPSGTHIWRVSSDGSDLRRLTNTPRGERLRSVSPDGRWLAYSQNDAWETTIRLLSTADGGSTVLASEVSDFIGFSTDGRRAIAGHQITDAAGLVHTMWVARSVPDGAPIDSLRLPDDASLWRWSPAADGIAFTRAADGYRNLYSLRFGGTAPVAVTGFEGGRILRWRASPDHRKLAIVRGIGADQNIWVTDADGGHPMQVTRFAGQEVFDVAWLTDSRRLALFVGTTYQDAVVVRDSR